MTPQIKIKLAILELAAEMYDFDLPESIDEDMLEELIEDHCDEYNDAKYEFRFSGIETNLSCESSRHYESESVAAQLRDGSWIGWTYWYGGGKHGEPAAIDWIEDAYFLDVFEEEKMTIVRTFSKK